MPEVTGKPRGRNGGRRVGSKDTHPRRPRTEPSKILSLRVPESLLHRIERQASLDGEKIADFVRDILDRVVV